MSITGKLISIVVMAVVGTLYAIVRAVFWQIEKGSVLGAIDEIKKDPAKAQHFSEAHDIVYGLRKNFKASYFDELKRYVHATTPIGEYNIVYCSTMNSNRLLVFTKLAFIDYDIDMTGHSNDTRKTVFVNFTLQYDHEQEELRVYSDVHYNATQKFHKEGFFRALFPG